MNASVKMTARDSLENEMKVFDSLPEVLREFLNYNTDGHDVRTIYHCYRNNNFDEMATVAHLNKVCASVWMR